MVTNESYKQLQDYYIRNFSLRELGPDISNKFAIISLVCYVTKKLKEKNPNATHLAVLRKINSDLQLPDEFIVSLSIVCEDFAYGCNNFPTFEVKPADMIKTIKDLLHNWMPF